MTTAVKAERVTGHLPSMIPFGNLLTKSVFTVQLGLIAQRHHLAGVFSINNDSCQVGEPSEGRLMLNHRSCVTRGLKRLLLGENIKLASTQCVTISSKNTAKNHQG
uniref:(northern house mosquito) hypothetical protein n=1 Tax=Culex pipiens TaxID=7175 RepID=A0A8D8CPI5_CULPI